MINTLLQQNVGALAKSRGGSGYPSAAVYPISQDALFEATYVARAHHPSD